MTSWLVLFVLGTHSVAHAEDSDNDGCDDAYEGNAACVSVSASVDPSTTIGASTRVQDSATVGPQLAVGDNVTIGSRATLAGRQAHVQSPLPVGDNVIVGRSASIGIDASLADDTVVGRSADVGARLTTGVGAHLGYAVTIGDDVTLGANAVTGNLAHVGDHAQLGASAVIGRGVTIADAAAPEDGSQIDGVVGPDTNIGEGVVVSSGARVRKGSTLDDGASILGSSRVGRNAHVGAGATVQGKVRANATIMPDATVQAGATVLRGATVCPSTTVPSGEYVLTTYPDTGCSAPTSCLDIWTDDNSSVDGIYAIDPDGTGPGVEFDAYCDMANGGWTLALQTAASGDTFTFLSSHWTTTSTLNETLLDPTADADAKYPAFNEVEGQEIRGCLRNTSTGVYGCKSYDLPSAQTLLEMFTNTPIGSRDTSKGYFFTESASERIEWVTMWGRSLAEASNGDMQYRDTGINIDDDQSNYRARVRFGLALNNESDIYTLNDTVGFGASAYYDSSASGLAQSPWRVGAGAAFGSTLIRTRGQIWVR